MFGINKVNNCAVSILNGANESLLFKYKAASLLSMAKVVEINFAKSPLVLTLFNINFTIGCWLLRSMRKIENKFAFFLTRKDPDLVLF